MSGNKPLLTQAQQNEILNILEKRFADNMTRHYGISWTTVQKKLEVNPKKLWSLYQMETTGGEPDLVGRDENTGELIFFDCAPESPKGRRRICYDQEALQSRKEHKPKNSAIGMAESMGIEILSEADYRTLQEFGEFDLKTSSWVKTPEKIRKLGGAIFGDRRYDTVFVYHNGAESYYGVRGFRGVLRV